MNILERIHNANAKHILAGDALIGQTIIGLGGNILIKSVEDAGEHYLGGRLVRINGDLYSAKSGMFVR